LELVRARKRKKKMIRKENKTKIPYRKPYKNYKNTQQNKSQENKSTRKPKYKKLKKRKCVLKIW